MSTTATKHRLGHIGIWSLELRFGNPGEAMEAAAELDDLGFGAIWIPGGVGGDVLGDTDQDITNCSDRLADASAWRGASWPVHWSNTGMSIRR